MFSVVEKKWNSPGSLNNSIQTEVLVDFLTQKTIARNLIKSCLGKDICLAMTESTSCGLAWDEVIHDMNLLLCR